MPHNEDAQPNEVRHARKGNSAVPIIRTSHSSVAPPGRGRGYTRNHPGRGQRGPGAPYMHHPPRRRGGSSTSAPRGEPARVVEDSLSLPPGHTAQRGGSSRKRRKPGNQGNKNFKRHGHPSVLKPELASTAHVQEPSLDITQCEYPGQTKTESCPEVRVLFAFSGRECSS